MSRLSDLDSDNKFDITRQKDIFDPHSHENAHCVLVGAGGIGSVTGLALTKLGIPKLTVIDFDTIEAVNLPNQMFPLNAIDVKKAAAAKSVWQNWGASEVTAYDGKVEDHPEIIHGVVIGGLDNMDARKALWEMVKKNIKVERYIDGRLGNQMINIFCINPSDPDDIKYYEENGIFDEEEGEELACTERGVIDMSFEVAAKMTRLVRRHYLGKSLERLTIVNHQELELLTV